MFTFQGQVQESSGIVLSSCALRDLSERFAFGRWWRWMWKYGVFWKKQAASGHHHVPNLQAGVYGNTPSLSWCSLYLFHLLKTFFWLDNCRLEKGVLVLCHLIQFTRRGQLLILAWVGWSAQVARQMKKLLQSAWTVITFSVPSAPLHTRLYNF